MAPNNEDEPSDNTGYNVDQESEGPRNGNVRRCPEEPSFDIFCHEFPVVAIAIVTSLIIQEEDSEGDADDDARGDGRTYQRGQEEVDHPS